MAFTVHTADKHPRDQQAFETGDRYKVIDGGALEITRKAKDFKLTLSPGYWLWVEDDLERPPTSQRSVIVV